MKHPLFCLIALSILVTGCPKKAPKAAVAPASADTNAAAAVEDNSQPTALPDGAQASVSPQPAQPLPPPPVPTREVASRAVNTVRQKVVGEVDAQLTSELRNFIQQKKRMPQSFAEFATMRLDSVPRPPEGKKWVIDAETQEVKAVASQ
jgi:hypothetical protein